MIGRRTIALAALLLLAAWTPAQAGGVWVGVGVGRPYYYRPYYGYYRPYVVPGIVVVAPAPTYIVPAPTTVYVQPAPTTVYQTAPPPQTPPAPEPIPAPRPAPPSLVPIPQ